MAALRLCLCLYSWFFSRQLTAGESKILSVNENTEFSDVKKADVGFTLYNHDIENGLRISLEDSDEDLRHSFRSRVPTVFITHGWLKNENHSSVSEVRKAYLETRDVNVIAVDWGNISQDDYVTVSSRISGIGYFVGRMAIRLLNTRIILSDNTHLLGHSLGAHVFGVAGGIVRDSHLGKVSRITGFDPARPGYNHVIRQDNCLDKEDAEFVDVIHTCIRMFGYTDPLGHADFYPNGGFCSQPGCHLSKGLFCGHGRSWRYYVESLYHENDFPAVECDSEKNYRTNHCSNNTIVLLGVATPISTQGVYFLSTNARPPYGRGNIAEP